MVGCCNTCNFEFDNFDNKKLHYKSEWHRYNLKLNVDGFEAVTKDNFVARQDALVLAMEKKKQDETRMLYSCALCCKPYRSSKAYAQHLISKTHLSRASNPENRHTKDAIVRPLLPRKETECEEAAHLAQDKFDTHIKHGCEDDFDPTCCFMCDLKNPTLDACVLHMQKKHGFLIPDVQYLKHAEGLLTHLGLQVTQDYMCLYCNERCHPFSSLEAVRKHMEAKSHFRIRFCNGGELEQFYDFTTRDMDKDGKLMVPSCDAENSVELGCGRYELILKGTTDDVRSAKTLGCREFSRYYKQYPRFEFANPRTKTLDLASRTKTDIKGLSKMQAKKVPTLQMDMWKYQRRFEKDAVKLKYTLYSDKLVVLPKLFFWG